MWLGNAHVHIRQELRHANLTSVCVCVHAHADVRFPHKSLLGQSICKKVWSFLGDLQRNTDEIQIHPRRMLPLGREP